MTLLATSPGLEPGTYCLEGSCSIQLSYEAGPQALAQAECNVIWGHEEGEGYPTSCCIRFNKVSIDHLSTHMGFPTADEVDAILYEFENDAREAIRALLHDLAILASDYGRMSASGT